MGFSRQEYLGPLSILLLEGTQDEQGEQQCGKRQGVAHGVHNLQPFQGQPLVLGVEVGGEDTEIELRSRKPHPF